MKLRINVDVAALTAALNSGSEAVELTVSVTDGETQVSSVSNAVPAARGPLAPLLRAGLLTAGEHLHLTQPRARRTAVAVVRPDGSLRIDGRTTTYWSPSKAAISVTGSSANGWTLWRNGDGRTLDDLRTELDEQSGDS